MHCHLFSGNILLTDWISNDLSITGSCIILYECRNCAKGMCSVIFSNDFVHVNNMICINSNYIWGTVETSSVCFSVDSGIGLSCFAEVVVKEKAWKRGCFKYFLQEQECIYTCAGQWRREGISIRTKNSYRTCTQLCNGLHDWGWQI